MKTVTAYISDNGVIERSPIRAAAWNLNTRLGKTYSGQEVLSFSSALAVLENIDTVLDVISELENELHSLNDEDKKEE